MMVFRYTNRSGASVANTANNATRYYPADRCIWTQENAPDGTGYRINNVIFYSGNDDNGVLLTETGGGTAELGFIGKSGRFVPITE